MDFILLQNQLLHQILGEIYFNPAWAAEKGYKILPNKITDKVWIKLQGVRRFLSLEFSVQPWTQAVKSVEGCWSLFDCFTGICIPCENTALIRRYRYTVGDLLVLCSYDCVLIKENIAIRNISNYMNNYIFLK